MNYFSDKLTEVERLSGKFDFEMAGYKLHSLNEELRQPRLVRIGAIQNSITLPTTEPVKEQREANWRKIQKMIEAAALAKVNVLCMQEAWGSVPSIIDEESPLKSL